MTHSAGAVEVVAADIGGTNARFAIARVEQGRVELGDVDTLRTSDFASLEEAWRAFAAGIQRPLPATAGIAVAAPVDTDTIALTNNGWRFNRASQAKALGLESIAIINDFDAVGHAVAHLDPACFRHLCGPDRPLPAQGVITIVGPGTGLGVAQLIRDPDRDRIVATEGGHVGFAPIDDFEDALLAALRRRHGRVSVERVVSGAGLAMIHASLAGREPEPDAKALWGRALAGDDALAAAALDRFCGALGAVAGDMALAHGAGAVAIAGGLGLRLAGHLPASSFAARFADKGRYRERLEAMPVRIVTHSQPGLIGAAIVGAAARGVHGT